MAHDLVCSIQISEVGSFHTPPRGPQAFMGVVWEPDGRPPSYKLPTCTGSAVPGDGRLASLVLSKPIPREPNSP